MNIRVPGGTPTLSYTPTDPSWPLGSNLRQENLPWVQTGQPTVVRQIQVADGAGVGDEILDDLGPCRPQLGANRCQHKGRPTKEILLSGWSHGPMAPMGALPHLAAAKIQVQVADVAVVRQPLQHGPGKVPRATHQHGQRGLCPSQPHPTSQQSPRQHPPQTHPLGRLPSPSHT